MKEKIFAVLLSVALLVVLFCNYSENRPTIQTSSRGECIPKKDVGSIRIDCTMDQANYEIIAGDLFQLRSFNLSGKSSANLRQLLGLRDTSGLSLLSWLQERIQYILNEDFESSTEDKSLLGLNYGSFRVRESHYSRTLLPKLSIPGHGVVEVNSHRLGIVQLKQEFFDLGRGKSQHLGRARIIQRLGILFHEARHSEGGSDNPGLPHVICPSGKGIPGKLACDESQSGAYGIERLFVRSALENCSSCTNYEVIFLWNVLSEIESHIL